MHKSKIPFKSYKVTIETESMYTKTIYTRKFDNYCLNCVFVCYTNDRIDCQKKYECEFVLQEKLSEEILSHIPLRLNHLPEDSKL